MNRSFPARILIIKTSSLGDIIQSFIVLEFLKKQFPEARIDWVTEVAWESIVSSHPLISRVIALDIKKKKGLWKGVQELRLSSYDVIFDLQGNCKSGLITWLAKGKVKVGYDIHSVREWPNVLATDTRFFVSKNQNIRRFYLGLIEAYCRSLLGIDLEEKVASEECSGIDFFIDDRGRSRIQEILSQSGSFSRIMVCPGSQWINKQLRWETLLLFLQKIEAVHPSCFFLVWGDEASYNQCVKLQAQLQRGYIVEKLQIPVWQNLMSAMDLVIAVDSSALHLCATTNTPTFSIFGPTASEVFKPIGYRHSAFQGSCPYHQGFSKQCPRLRTCPTGACIRDLDASEIFEAFLQKNNEIFTGGRKGNESP